MYLYTKGNPTIPRKLFKSSAELNQGSDQCDGLLLEVLSSDSLSIEHELVAIFVGIAHVELVCLQ